MISQSEECCICFEIISERGIINTCNHVFCFSCIVKWSKIRNSCPLCRKHFSKIVPSNKQIINLDSEDPVFTHTVFVPSRNTRRRLSTTTRPQLFTNDEFHIDMTILVNTIDIDEEEEEEDSDIEIIGFRTIIEIS